MRILNGTATKSRYRQWRCPKPSISPTRDHIQLINWSYRQMLRSLFNLLWPYHVQVEVTFECDASIKAGEHMRSDFDIHFKFFKFHAPVQVQKRFAKPSKWVGGGGWWDWINWKDIGCERCIRRTFKGFWDVELADAVGVLNEFDVLNFHTI